MVGPGATSSLCSLESYSSLCYHACSVQDSQPCAHANEEYRGSNIWGNREPQPVDQRFTLFFLMDDPEIHPSILRYPMVLANHSALMDSQCITIWAFSSLFLLP